MKFSKSIAVVAGALAVMSTVAFTATASESTDKAGPRPLSEVSANAEYAMFSAPRGDTYRVGTISGSDSVWAYECVGGWRHIRTAAGRAGSHHANSVAWVNIGC
ncbi:hypothetical protein LFM09_00345 [Lentzea alba]|uniref:hypothetical protein n=1 Tax=Lentzea alba TaxID=2714351 RepID=UPI0039BFB713